MAVHRLSVNIPQWLWMLQAGIDIGGNITNGVLHSLVAGFQGGFNLTDGMHDCGVILRKFVANVGKAEVGQLSDQVHGHLTCFRNTAGTLSAA